MELQKAINSINQAMLKISNLENENENLKFMLYRMLIKHGTSFDDSELSDDEIEKIKTTTFMISENEIYNF